MNLRREPTLSENVPKKNVEKVLATAVKMTIAVTMFESIAIFAYMNVLNHWLTTFQQSWPASPSPHTKDQNRSTLIISPPPRAVYHTAGYTRNLCSRDLWWLRGFENVEENKKNDNSKFPGKLRVAI